jgi:hypothetical protein
MLIPAQLATLKATIIADPTAGPIRATGDTVSLLEWCNGDSAKVVWRTAMSPAMSRIAIINGATQLDALTVGKRDSLLWLCELDLNPTLPAVRAALDDLCGTQNTLKSSLQAAQKRLSTRAEAVFATGTGTTQSPADLVFEGQVTQEEVNKLVAP